LPLRARESISSTGSSRLGGAAGADDVADSILVIAVREDDGARAAGATGDDDFGRPPARRDLRGSSITIAKIPQHRDGALDPERTSWWLSFAMQKRAERYSITFIADGSGTTC